MSDERSRFVVDASVGIKLFVDEPLSDRAYALFSKLSEEPPAELHVPGLFYIECTNILLKYVRRFRRSIEDSQADIADLKLLTLKSTPTVALVEESILLASQEKLSAYDACYAILAQRLAMPLITADEPLAKAVDWAIRLEDFKP